jgi:hypothetical protein
MTMNTTLHIVVGDDYARFAECNSDVVTTSAMMTRLQDPSLWQGRHKVLLGQGISERTRLAMMAALEELGVDDVQPVDPSSPLQLTHKRSKGHVLITEPCRMADQAYRFGLLLDAQNDRLSDHVTGQHVGAMLLMEAARQAVVATLECAYVQPRGTPLGLVLERFDSSFQNYAFPLPTQLTVTVTEREGRQSRNIAVSLDVAFEQAGLQVCRMVLDVNLIEAAVLDAIETRKARKCVDLLRSQALSILPDQLIPV